MMDSSRLALAAALTLTVGVSAATAQTVVLRSVPAGSTIDIVVNNAAAQSTKSDAGGDVVIPIKMFATASKTEADAQVLVDSCGTARKVFILERGYLTPPEESGCSRRDMGGWFVIQPVSSLVIDLGGSSPTLLLRQGSYSLSPPRTWDPSPTGLVLFGGGSYNKFSTVRDVACGTLTSCSGGDAAFGFTAGVAYWITPYLAAEASYIRPPEIDVEGSGDNFRFTSTLDPHIFTAVGKVGVPAGPIRPYGQVGGNYHRATFSTNQTVTSGTESGTQGYSLETGGWSWIFGGGLETWFSSSFGIYGEINRAAIKGPAVDKDVEGEIDDRLTTILFGVRIKIGG
ncbi:MAG TPA: outer membrane beta-barrel protein [Vicinamibacterales bacterium]|nr:outer membrane beta-barrel protein [Vicinamibacterales bacterium]